MNYVDRKYIDEIGPYLKNFDQKSNTVWNCRCPYCNDSKTNKRKARGYFFVGKDGNLIFSCHNCSIGEGGVSLGSLIQTHFPHLYTQYRLDRMKTEKIETKLDLTPNVVQKRIDRIKLAFTKPIKSSIPLTELPQSHSAVQYMVSRMIPDLSPFMYTPDFSMYVAEMTDNDPRYEKLVSDERIIIPIRTPDGSLMGFQGRLLDPSGTKTGLRYITIKLDENFTKLYGLDRFNKDKPGFIVEGPLDSSFLPNCLAMCGSSLDESAIDKEYIIPEKTIIIYDNESRNREIVYKMEKTINKGFRVFIPPSGLSTSLKDINKMVMEGTSPRELITMFVNCSYTGVRAKLELNAWKRVK